MIYKSLDSRGPDRVDPDPGGALKRLQARIVQLEVLLRDTSLVERAALELWGRAAAELVGLRTPEGGMPLEYLSEVAVRCWRAAQIFADSAGAATPPPPTKGGA